MAPVLCLRRIYGLRGLVNGALGTVIDLTWSEGATIKKDLPLAVLIAFDKYEDDGPISIALMQAAQWSQSHIPKRILPWRRSVSPHTISIDCGLCRDCTQSTGHDS